MSNSSKERTIRIVQTILNGSYRFSTRLSGWLTYQVLVRPPKHEAEPEEEAFIAQAERSFRSQGRLQLACFRWRGNGPKVLLAHGWDSYSGRWYPVAERLLAAGFDLYAFDAPAHGDTNGGTFSVHEYAECMATVMLDVQPDIVIGHSAGGMAAIYYFQLFPENFTPSRMVMLGVPGDMTDFVERFRQVLGLNPRTIEALDSYFQTVWGHPLSYYSISRFATVLKIPGLIIHDQEDEVAPYAGALAIAKNWSQADLLPTQGLGHSLQAPVVWDAILAFCQNELVKS